MKYEEIEKYVSIGSAKIPGSVSWSGSCGADSAWKVLVVG